MNVFLRIYKGCGMNSAALVFLIFLPSFQLFIFSAFRLFSFSSFQLFSFSSLIWLPAREAQPLERLLLYSVGVIFSYFLKTWVKWEKLDQPSSMATMETERSEWAIISFAASTLV